MGNISNLHQDKGYKPDNNSTKLSKMKFSGKGAQKPQPVITCSAKKINISNLLEWNMSNIAKLGKDWKN